MNNKTMGNRQQNQGRMPGSKFPLLTETNFGGVAEQVIKSLKAQGKLRVTTSQIRVLLSMSNNLYNALLEERGETLNSDLKSMIQYLRMKFAYQAGRENSVKDFVEKANLMRELASIGESREKAIIFCKYMESLVAYHKYYDDRDR